MQILQILVLIGFGALIFMVALFIGFNMGRVQSGQKSEVFEIPPKMEKNPEEEDPYMDAMRRPQERIQTMKGED